MLSVSRVGNLLSRSSHAWSIASRLRPFIQRRHRWGKVETDPDATVVTQNRNEEPPPADFKPVYGILWFDNIYPIRIHFLDPRHLFNRRAHRVLVPGFIPDDVKLYKMVPRKREGGVFALIQTTKPDQSIDAICDQISNDLKQRKTRALFIRRPICVHKVRGDPWVEDLRSRFPSNRVKIDLRGPLVSSIGPEELYAELRGFGPLLDLIALPIQKDSPTPRSYLVVYKWMEGGVGARNCLHRFQLGDAIMMINYDSILKTSVITDFFVKHPRIVLPLLGLLIALFTFLIFDPLREFSIQNRITGRFAFTPIATTTASVQWMADFTLSWTERLLALVGARQQPTTKVDPTTHTVAVRVVESKDFAELRDDDEENRDWIVVEDSSRPDVETDPQKADTAFGDAEPPSKATGANLVGLLSETKEAIQTGANLLGLLSETKEAKTVVPPDAPLQVKQTNVQTWRAREKTEQIVDRWLHAAAPGRVLFLAGDHGAGKSELIGKAIKGRANVVKIDVTHLLDKSEDEFIQDFGDALGFFPGFRFITWAQSLMDLITPGASKAASAGAQTTTKIVKILECTTRALMKLQPAPADKLPTFIIEGFNEENKTKQQNVFRMLVEWAGGMSEAKLARFAFLTETTTLEESVARELPQIPVETIVLRDAPLRSAVEFVLSNTKQMTRAEAITAVNIVGGRYSDLLSLIRGVESGTPAPAATEDIVQHGIKTVRGFLFGTGPAAANAYATKFSKVQLWSVLLAIVQSKSNEVGYDDVLFTVFKGDDAALRALLRTDIVRMQSAPERVAVRAGSPVMLEVFRRLANDRALRPGMDLAVTKFNLDTEMTKIAAIEDEMLKLQKIVAQPLASSDRHAVEQRKALLSQTLLNSHSKVDLLERDRIRCETELKKIRVLRK